MLQSQHTLGAGLRPAAVAARMAAVTARMAAVTAAVTARMGMECKSAGTATWREITKLVRKVGGPSLTDCGPSRGRGGHVGPRGLKRSIFRFGLKKSSLGRARDGPANPPTRQVLAISESKLAMLRSLVALP